jgi:hypothetical protein
VICFCNSMTIPSGDSRQCDERGYCNLDGGQGNRKSEIACRFARAQGGLRRHAEVPGAPGSLKNGVRPAKMAYP